MTPEKLLDLAHEARERQVNAARVQVAVGRLAGIRVAHRERGQHIGAHRVVRAPVPLSRGDGQVLAGRAVHPVQAGVVVVALQAVELEAAGKRRRERGQLMADELVGERVRLCGDAHRHVVALGEQRHGQEVRQ